MRPVPGRVRLSGGLSACRPFSESVVKDMDIFGRPLRTGHRMSLGTLTFSQTLNLQGQNLFCFSNMFQSVDVNGTSALVQFPLRATINVTVINACMLKKKVKPPKYISLSKIN